METNQTKIMAANSTVIMMRKADPYASWERTQKEDGRPRSSRRRKANSTEHATIVRRRVAQAEIAEVKRAKAKAKANKRAKEDTPRVSMDMKVDTTTTTTVANMDTQADTTTATAATRKEASS